MSAERRTPERTGPWASLVAASRSWRTLSVALLSFPSGLPLGLVWIAIPDWLRSVGVDIRVVGLITLTQAPWSFKFLWAPFLDRYLPPGLRWLGRRRGWAAVAQVALLVFTLGLAGVATRPEAPWIIAALALAIAVASASQDIAIDAYAVDVLRPEEQGIAAGARVAVYRVAMWVSGFIAISMAGEIGWPLVNLGLAILYLPMLAVTLKAPEPEEEVVPPRSLKEAVWNPFLGFLARHRAVEILAFVFFYKLVDQLADALKRPFLIDMGYNAWDRGVILGTLGTVTMVVAILIGGSLTTVVGLGHSLWIFGLLQIVSNLGYVLVAGAGGVDRPLMYGAMAFETFCQGLGTGAFSVLLLRMTQKRFSATQYALFSSMFGLPRVLAGPIAGFTVYAVGWKTFFWLTLLAGVPGLAFLARFVPPGTRDPTFTIEPPRPGRPLTRRELTARGVAGALAGAAVAALAIAALGALEAVKDNPAGGYDLVAPLAAMLRPSTAGGWLELAGVVAFGAVCGLFAAAVAAARHGAGRELALDEGAES